MVILQPLYLDRKFGYTLSPSDKFWFRVIKKYYPDGFIAKLVSYNLHQRSRILTDCTIKNSL